MPINNSHDQINHAALDYSGVWVSFGFTHWKKYMLPKFMRHAGAKFKHADNPEKAVQLLEKHQGSRLLIWGQLELPEALSHYTPVRVEDGFLRSRGLGADFNLPLSLAFDPTGIYFNSQRTSRLEEILESHTFSTQELEQADALIDFLRTHKLTKYNLGISEATLPHAAHGQRTILVPGQVDADASIAYGSPVIHSNRELLKKIRECNPDAYILYKPHPDLLAGVRTGAPLWDGIENDVDHLIESGDVISWIQAVDEVHTLTSTVGFEALINQKPVSTYGIPFYANWGLTNDLHRTGRRTASRSLRELVAAALVLYPIYVHPKTNRKISAIEAANLLIDESNNAHKRPLLLRLLGKIKVYLNNRNKED